VAALMVRGEAGVNGSRAGLASVQEKG